MNKELKDYLPYYVGQKCIEEGGGKGHLLGVMIQEGKIRALVNCSSNEQYWTSAENIKLLLRPLSTMTTHEWGMLGNTQRKDIHTCGGLWKANADETAYLLNRGFDLFGLIESNLAISKTETEKANPL